MTTCFVTMFALEGKTCCWHSLWLRCVSSKAVCHTLVTQRELLISQERDVLASAPGSFEDKQVPRATKNDVYVEKFSGGDAATCHIPLHAPPRTGRPDLMPAPRLRARSLAHLWTQWLVSARKQSCDATVPIWKWCVLKFNLAIFPLNEALAARI